MFGKTPRQPSSTECHAVDGAKTYKVTLPKGIPEDADAVYFGPKQPDAVKRWNWIPTMPNKRWFVILRLYSPRNRSGSMTWAS